ncbi:MAG TPA: hypothetical protein VGK89_01975 [Candidatus Eisenbacteria bacterium]|jgi:hypothetical protein
MIRRPIARAAAVALAPAAAVLALLACGARAEGAAPAALAPIAQPAPPDTALDRFLGTLSDSTDAYFGLSAAPTDTAGLDSALASGLARGAARPRARRRPALGPELGFNRVDGPSYGAAAAIGAASGLGRLEGRIGWASGPNDLLGGAAFLRSLSRGDATWSLRLAAGRRTDGMDRDFGDLQFAMLDAFVTGKDYQRYLRRDGFEVRLAREARSWRAAAGFRDLLESPLATRVTWNLAGATPAVRDNLAAARGRNHEFAIEAAARWPRLPVRSEIEHASSSRAAGSDFEYRRTRVSLAADLAAGRWLAIVPQLSYGRLSGEPVPQAAFFLGGAHTLRSIPGGSRGGEGLALARLDAIEAHDLLALARLPHPAWLPLQAAAFAAAGSAWGADPYGGPRRGGVDWPDAEHWALEAGASLLWRPGLPDPTGFVRASYAWPLGPGREPARFTLSWSRAIDLVGPFGE